MPRLSVTVLGVVAAMLAACGDAGPSSRDPDALEGRLTLTGSSTVAPVAAEIAKRYETLHPGVRIDVQTGGSSRGIADARGGLADIGMSSRALKPAERDGVVEHVLARDGVAFVIHADNPVETLTHEQVLDIYTGRIDNWRDVGGRDAPIVVINRAEGRSELELVTGHFRIKPSQIDADVVAGENQQCVKLVSGNPDAIVYLSVGTAEFEASRGAPLKPLPMDGVAASTATVRAGAFPLGRPLVLITRPGASPLAESFVAYALSDQVHDLIERQSFVPTD